MGAAATARGEVWFASWAYLLSFRPPTQVQQNVVARYAMRNPHDPEMAHFYFHKLEEAYGDINLDFFPVHVTRLPPSVSSPEALLDHIRRNINDFVRSASSVFTPYDEKYPATGQSGDKARWLSADPESAVVSIDMNLRSKYLTPDKGSVVCAHYSPRSWIFSTIWTPTDEGHPVSGNREFGFHPRFDPPDGSYIFYTFGADRTTGASDYALNAATGVVFSSADRLWQSFQDGIVTYVTRLGGEATKLDKQGTPTDWNAVKVVAYKPTVSWI